MTIATEDLARLMRDYDWDGAILSNCAEIATLARDKRQVIRLASPILPAGAAEPDTRWWWH